MTQNLKNCTTNCLSNSRTHWTTIVENLFFSSKFELNSRRYTTVENEWESNESKRKSHVYFVLNIFNLNLISLFRNLYSSWSLLFQFFLRNLRFTFTFNRWSKITTQSSTNWSTSINVTFVTKSNIFKKYVLMHTNTNNVNDTICKWYKWTWFLILTNLISIRKIKYSHQKRDWWMFKNFFDSWR